MDTMAARVTDKMRQFVDAYMNCKADARAAALAVGVSERSASKTASRWLKHPLIAAEIKERMAAAAAASKLAADLSAQRIIDELASIALFATEQGTRSSWVRCSDKLKALQLLGQELHGMFDAELRVKMSQQQASGDESLLGKLTDEQFWTLRSWLVAEPEDQSGVAGQGCVAAESGRIPAAGLASPGAGDAAGLGIPS